MMLTEKINGDSRLIISIDFAEKLRQSQESWLSVGPEGHEFIIH